MKRLAASSDREHARLLSADVALGETAGPTLVVGEPPDDLLAGIAACASGVTLVGDVAFSAYARRLLEGCSPAWVSEVMPASAESLASLDPHQNAVIWGLPGEDAAPLLEAALSAVVDGGRVFVSIPRQRGRDGVVERLTRSLCDGRVSVPAHTPPWRLALEGWRRALTHGAAQEQGSDLLPVSVIVTVRSGHDGLEALLCDLLLRQHLPPLELWVMDLAGSGEAPLPEDLYGLPERSPVRTILCPAGPVTRAAAVNDALGGVGQPFVALLAPPLRVSSNHLACLGMALEAQPRWGAVVGLTAARDTAGRVASLSPAVLPHADLALRALLEGARLETGSALFRSEALRAVSGLDPQLEEGAEEDLWLRLAATRPVGAVSLPLASVPGASPGGAWWSTEVGRRVAERAARVLDEAHLQGLFPECARQDRARAAELCLGRFLLDAGLASEALARADAVLAAAPACDGAADLRRRALALLLGEA